MTLVSGSETDMADSRYREHGYSAQFNEYGYGAYLTIRRNDVIVAELSVGFFSGGPDATVTVRRFKPKELRDVKVADDFKEE